MNGITYVCAQKDIVCGSRPENWCERCPLRPQVAVAPHAAAGPYPTAMRPATNEEVMRLRGRLGSVEDAIQAARNSAFEAAALACEAEGRKSMAVDGNSFYIATGQCAKAIRALKNDSAIGGVHPAHGSPYTDAEKASAWDKLCEEVQGYKVESARRVQQENLVRILASTRRIAGVPPTHQPKENSDGA